MTTDGSGNASFSPTFSETVSAGSAISAIVSRLDGGDAETDTSEFAQNVIATAAANNAPVLADSGVLTLSTITEDDTGNNGNLISEILASDFLFPNPVTDVDPAALEGIAIHSLNSSNGTWEYNIGVGWNTVSPVTWNSSLLLRDTDRLRFVPDGLDDDLATVSFTAWDQTSGAAGTKVDTSTYDPTGAFSFNVEVATINVTAVNDDPTVTNLIGDMLNYAEGDGAVVIEQGGDVLVSDVDSSNFSGGSLNVEVDSGLVDSEDVFSIRNQGTGLGQIGVSGSNVTYEGTVIGTYTGGTGLNPLTVTFNSNATPVAVTALIKNITYENTNLAMPTVGARGVTIDINDGDGGGSQTQNLTINVSAVNDAPTFSATNSTPTFTENGGAVSLFSGTSVDPVEAGDLIDTLVVTVASLADGSNEILMVDGQSIELTHLNSETTLTNGYDVDVSVSGSDASVTITKAGGFTAAAAESLVDGLGYNNTSENPQGAVRLVNLISIKDDGGTANGGADTKGIGIASLVTISAVNDAPAISAPATATAAEETPLVFSVANGNPIVISDVDAGAGLVSVTVSISNGTATLASIVGVNTVSGDGTGTISLYGTLTSINNALNGLTFVAASNYDETSRININVNDFGNTGPGFVMLEDSHTIDVTITPVNDAPVTVTDSYTVAEDATLNVAAPGVLANDRDLDSSDPSYVTEFGSAGSADGEFSNPGGIAFDSSGNLYVVDTNNDRVQVFDSSRNHLFLLVRQDRPTASLTSQVMLPSIQTATSISLTITMTGSRNLTVAAPIY